MEELTEVVAAVIERPDGSVLLGRRPEGKVYAGYWEFPGGKIEAGEAPARALERELREELGIVVERAYPWLTLTYRYPHAHVRLRFFRVKAWRGEPRPHEAQELAWTGPERASVAPMLPANGPVLRALALPDVMAVTCASEIGESNALRALERALARGVRLVMVREKDMAPERRLNFALQAVSLCRAHSALAVINSDLEAARRCNADGVHLPAAQLGAAAARPAFAWCGASCHDRSELERAIDLGCDYALLGPVLRTQSHPAAESIGWTRFAELLRDRSLPVYAIGGMRREHLEPAWRCGAHGIAMMRAAWLD